MTLKEKIDKAAALNKEYKAIETELKALKSELKAHARKHGKFSLDGNKTTAHISAQSFVNVPPGVFQIECDERGLEFLDFIKVKNADAKKAIGETAFNEIAETDRDEFGKISFKTK